MQKPSSSCGRFTLAMMLRGKGPSAKPCTWVRKGLVNGLVKGLIKGLVNGLGKE